MLFAVAVAPGAKKALKGSGYLEAILAGQESIVGPQGTTAALLQQNMTQQMSGYAITAKPSANLYILLQVRPPSKSIGNICAVRRFLSKDSEQTLCPCFAKTERASHTAKWCEVFS